MRDIISKPVLVSGSSVGPLEVHYAADAAQTGWNEKCFDYLKQFEETVCQVLGVKYAIATPSCTAALHLALLTLGVKTGDEVILPDSTWVATANAVAYTGATPVFVDVCRDDWTIDPEAVKRAITPRTRAIIAVHLYGHPCKMDELNAIAGKYGIRVIEDAAESMGSLYHGKHTGALGDMACFSFHGSKTVVMGEGGVFTTNDEQLYARARFLGDQAKHPTKRFYNEEIGYKFRLSNIQAAFGLAQMERLEEIVAKKRQIFQWYQEELAGIEGLTLNPELPDVRNNYWMVTPVLAPCWKGGAEKLLVELEKRAVSVRPFFYPCTELPVYAQYRREPTPVAHELHEQGLNLPCGAELSQEEVHYICAHLRNILTNADIGQPVTGWLARREQFLQAKEEFPLVDFIDPDFRKMDCEIQLPEQELPAVELLEAIHQKLGFRRIFLRRTIQQEESTRSLAELGFIEYQKIPYVDVPGHGRVELFRQPYADVCIYETIFMKTL